MRYYKDRDTQLQLETILNKGVDFVDNIRGGFVELTTTGAEETIRHNLGYIPSGWLVIYTDAVVTLHATSVASWTRETMFLTSSVGSVTVRLFVM